MDNRFVNPAEISQRIQKLKTSVPYRRLLEMLAAAGIDEADAFAVFLVILRDYDHVIIPSLRRLTHDEDENELEDIFDSLRR